MLTFFFFQVEAVIQSLNSVCFEKKTSTDEEWGELGISSTGKKFIKMNFPKLVEQLKAQDKLPALVFRYKYVYIGFDIFNSCCSRN